MASPPCCPADSTPSLSHTPPFVGKVVDIENDGGTMKAYVTGAALETSTHIVVVFSDVFGYDSGRHFEFADHMATLLNKSEDVKATVLVPDVFFGRPLIVDYRFLPEFVSVLLRLPSFIYRVRIGGTKKFTDPTYKILFPWLAEQQGVDLGMVNLSWIGFCFGSWLGCKFMAYSRSGTNNDKSTPSWTCGVGIHPALQVEQITGNGSEEDLASSLGDAPVKLMPASNDAYRPGESKVVEIMATNQTIPEDQVSVLFNDVKHGFCSRGDSSDEKVKRAQQKAEALAAEFILQHSSTS